MQTIEQAIRAMAAGKFVVVTDDAARENEGDLIMAADAITPEKMNFMIRYGRGLICLPITPERAQALSLPLMTQRNTSAFGTQFTVSISAARGITTGISAHDRAATVRAAVKKNAQPDDLTRPGHIFPLIAHLYGVLGRAGHTEAGVDLACLAGRIPAAVLCEILDDSGRSARGAQLKKFIKRHGLVHISIAELISYRQAHEKLVTKVAVSSIPTAHGSFKIHAYKDIVTGKEHIALTYGALHGKKIPLIRIHSSCATGDIFGSLRCDCQAQLHAAMAAIARHGSGAVIYLSQEGRGIGLTNKVRAYALQDRGLDTVQANEKLGFKADERQYYPAAQILKDLGIAKITLLTNNPGKLRELAQYGLTAKRQSLWTAATKHNAKYLAAKKRKLKHLP